MKKIIFTFAMMLTTVSASAQEVKATEPIDKRNTND